MLKKALEKWNNVPIQAKASVSYTICSLVQKGLSFLTLPLFTRLLTVEQYGQYSVYASWSSMLTIFITLYLAYGSLSTAMVQFEDSRKAYLAAIQNICVALAGVFLVIYLPFRHLWNELFGLPTALVCLMVAEIVMQFSISCWYRLKQFEYKYKSVIAMTLATTVTMPALALLLITQSAEKGYARIFGYALVTIAVGAVLFLITFVQGKGGFQRRGQCDGCGHFENVCGLRYHQADHPGK